MIYEIYGRTETGPVRPHNEDHILVGRYLKNRGGLGLSLADDDECLAGGGLALAVADGMGGLAGGALASRTALLTLDAALGARQREDTSPVSAPDVENAVHRAHEAVRAARGQIDGPDTRIGTTLSGVLLTGSGYWVFHAGDSRVLRVRNGFLRPLTVDDTLAERLYRLGVDAATAQATRDSEALVNWVGTDDFECKVEAGPALETGDLLVVCSDGLHAFVSAKELGRTLSAPEKTVRQLTDMLVELALASGSDDNVSLVLLRATGETGQATHDENTHGE